MKKVYIKIKTVELTVPCLGNTMTNIVYSIAQKLGQKLDLMFYQVMILED